MPRADAETVAKSLDWVNHQLRVHPKLDKLKAVEEAAMKFDLGPLDEEWLLRQLTQHPGPSPSGRRHRLHFDPET